MGTQPHAVDAEQTLRSCATAPAQAHDLALLDLDGVVYVGRRPVPGAAEALERARAEGMRIAFVTNNASRTPGRGRRGTHLARGRRGARTMW